MKHAVSDAFGMARGNHFIRGDAAGRLSFVQLIPPLPELRYQPRREREPWVDRLLWPRNRWRGHALPAVLSAWIEASRPLFKALDYDQIDKMVNGWTDDDEAGLIGREYSRL